MTVTEPEMPTARVIRDGCHLMCYGFRNCHIHAVSKDVWQPFIQRRINADVKDLYKAAFFQLRSLCEAAITSPPHPNPKCSDATKKWVVVPDKLVKIMANYFSTHDCSPSELRRIHAENQIWVSSLQRVKVKNQHKKWLKHNEDEILSLFSRLEESECLECMMSCCLLCMKKYWRILKYETILYMYLNSFFCHCPQMSLNRQHLG